MTDLEHAALLAAAASPREGRARAFALGLSEARHAQLVDGLLDRPDAEAAEPVIVHRLRRLRALRKAARTA